MTSDTSTAARRTTRLPWRGMTTHRVLTSVETGRGALLPIRVLTLSLFGAVVLLTGLAGSSAIRYGLVISTAYAIAMLGNNFIAGTLREINLGTGASLALGAYITSNAFEHSVPFFLTAALAGAGAAVAGFVMAIPTTRLKGIQVALVTFALAYSISDLATYLSPVTGGDSGKPVFATFAIGEYTFSGSDPGLLVLTVVTMLLAGLAHLWLLNSKPGRSAITVGEAEQAAAVFGTRVRLVRVLVWTWASFLGGIAGFLFALGVGYVGSQVWTVTISLVIFVGGLIGGTRSATGAWIGGIIVAGLPLWLQDVVPPSSSSIAFGLILLVALLAGGKGITGWAERAGVAAVNHRRSKR